MEPSWRHLGGVLAPYWPVLAPSWAVLGASWPPKSLPKLVQNPSWGPHKTRSNIDPNLESLGDQKTLKFLRKNKYFHKPDSTWNGKRRLSLCFLKEAFWNGFGSQSFPNVPERSARFARCARSLAALVHRGELPLIFLVFLMFYTIFDIVSISIDLSWMFMPTWPHVS